MTEMVDRVAKVLASHGLHKDFEWEQLANSIQGTYKNMAVACIAVMLRPTQEMIDIGAACSGEDFETTAIGAWQGMICAAVGWPVPDHWREIADLSFEPLRLKTPL